MPGEKGLGSSPHPGPTASPAGSYTCSTSRLLLLVIVISPARFSHSHHHEQELVPSCLHLPRCPMHSRREPVSRKRSFGQRAVRARHRGLTGPRGSDGESGGQLRREPDAAQSRWPCHAAPAALGTRDTCKPCRALTKPPGRLRPPSAAAALPYPGKALLQQLKKTGI